MIRHKGTDFASERLHNQQQEAQQTRVRDYNTLEDEKICQTHGYGIEQRERVMKHVRKDVVKTNRCPSNRFWTLGSSPAATSVPQVVQGIASKLPANTWKGKKRLRCLSKGLLVLFNVSLPHFQNNKRSVCLQCIAQCACFFCSDIVVCLNTHLLPDFKRALSCCCSQLRSSSVSVVFVFNASLSALSPSSPMPFTDC